MRKTLFDRMSEAARLVEPGEEFDLPFALNTGDPKFDPQKPVTVNGFLYLPALAR